MSLLVIELVTLEWYFMVFFLWKRNGFSIFVLYPMIFSDLAPKRIASRENSLFFYRMKNPFFTFLIKFQFSIIQFFEEDWILLWTNEFFLEKILFFLLDFCFRNFHNSKELEFRWTLSCFSVLSLYKSWMENINKFWLIFLFIW